MRARVCVPACVHINTYTIFIPLALCFATIPGTNALNVVEQFTSPGNPIMEAMKTEALGRHLGRRRTEVWQPDLYGAPKTSTRVSPQLRLACPRGGNTGFSGPLGHHYVAGDVHPERTSTVDAVRCDGTNQSNRTGSLAVRE